MGVNALGFRRCPHVSRQRSSIPKGRTANQAILIHLVRLRPSARSTSMLSTSPSPATEFLITKPSPPMMLADPGSTSEVVTPPEAMMLWAGSSGWRASMVRA